MNTSAIPENPRWETSNKVRRAIMVYDYDEPVVQEMGQDEDEEQLRERLKRERLEKEAESEKQRRAMFAEQKKKMEQEQERRKKREEAYLETQRKRREEQSSVQTEDPFTKTYNELAKRPRYRKLFNLVNTVESIDRIKTNFLNQERSDERQELQDLKQVRTQLADLAQQYEEELPSDINDYIADRYVELNNYIERSFNTRLSRGPRTVYLK